MGKKQEYKQKNEEYLKEVSQREGIKVLPHGILYEIIKEGTGEGKVQSRSIVTCNYRGSLISGKVFDDSWQRGVPEAFRYRLSNSSMRHAQGRSLACLYPLSRRIWYEKRRGYSCLLYTNL